MADSNNVKLFCPHCGHNLIKTPAETEPKTVVCASCGKESRFADLKTVSGDTLEQHLGKMLVKSFGGLLK
jgi:DNA-directed RNA polymerase subunit M/transcription elongation factor TFIIS